MDKKFAQSAFRKPIRLSPVYKEYVWGGDRLRRGKAPTAEAWIVYDNGEILSEPFTGKRLAEISNDYPNLLLGKQPMQRTGARFPLLIKLLDSAAWLSLQVHPDDAQAKKLEGAGYTGKTEAWHVIDATPGARIIAGFQPGCQPEEILKAIANGNILGYAQYLEVQSGQTLFIQPGTLHSIGPGLLLYEVQQNSDLTYRVYDWDRPQTGGRVLHIEKSLAVVNPALHPLMIPAPELHPGDQQVLCRSQYFTLSKLFVGQDSLHLDTKQQSFHVITVLSGTAEVAMEGGSEVLVKFETALIPAACGKYEISARQEPVEILLAFED